MCYATRARTSGDLCYLVWPSLVDSLQVWQRWTGSVLKFPFLRELGKMWTGILWTIICNHVSDAVMCKVAFGCIYHWFCSSIGQEIKLKIITVVIKSLNSSHHQGWRDLVQPLTKEFQESCGSSMVLAKKSLQTSQFWKKVLYNFSNALKAQIWRELMLPNHSHWIMTALTNRLQSMR